MLILTLELWTDFRVARILFPARRPSRSKTLAVREVNLECIWVELKYIHSKVPAMHCSYCSHLSRAGYTRP
jgi:hypothetical protein